MNAACIIVGVLLCVGVAVAKDNLHVAYEWREMDFQYDSPDQRWSAIERGAFKPANVIPFGLEVYRQRLFVTLPRWRDGVPASLAYLDLNGKYQSRNHFYPASRPTFIYIKLRLCLCANCSALKSQLMHCLYAWELFDYCYLNLHS